MDILKAEIAKKRKQLEEKELIVSREIFFTYFVLISCCRDRTKNIFGGQI